ncbi:hypothetical protein [Actinoplanes sp. GCM10030250]|uniref:hypothetical protein n=1 Tax=Actinoplanes sp. GCM10030250 TaxID=3273376 RepID=UPI0036108511
MFAAEGLNGSEKGLLQVFANLCTQKGALTADMGRLTRMSGMSESTVTRTRQSLELKGIVKTRRRNERGERLENAYLINAEALAARCPAEPEEFGDDVLAALFAEDAENALDQQVRQSDGYGPSKRRICRSEAENALTSKYVKMTDTVQGADQQVRQNDGTKEEEVLSKEPPPTPSSLEDGKAFVSTLPRYHVDRFTAGQRFKLEQAAAEALAAGHDRDALRRELTADLEGARSVFAVMSKRIRDLPDTPLPPRLRVVPADESPAASAERAPHNPAPPTVFTEPGITFVPSRLRGSQRPAEPSNAHSGTDTRTV